MISHDYTIPMVLSMSKGPDSKDGLNKLLAPVLDEYATVNVVFIAIILHKNQLLIILDKK